MPTPTSARDGGSRFAASAAPRARRSSIVTGRDVGTTPPSLCEARQALGLLILLIVMLPAYGLSRHFVDDIVSDGEMAETDGTEMQVIVEHIRDTAARHGVSEHLVAAIIAVESEFYPRAVSRKGARGLMQLMPATASSYNVRDPFDPRENIEGGVRHLKQLMRRYRNNLPVVLAAYNAGDQAVRRHGGIPPYPETRRYVRRVLRKYQQAALIPPAPVRHAGPAEAIQPQPSAAPAAAVQPEPSAAPAATVRPDKAPPPAAPPVRGRARGRDGAAIRVDRARTQSSPPPRRAPVPGKGTRALAPAAAVVGLA